MSRTFTRDLQFVKFSAYGFLKNLQFAEPFLVLFLLSRGMDYLQIGTLYAIRMVAVNVLEVPSGITADALGRRGTMLTAFGGYLLSFVVFYAGGAFLHFVVAMLLFAVGEAFRTGTHKAMIMSYLASRGWLHLKPQYYGRTRSWSQLGAALSAAIAALIVFAGQSYGRVFLFSMIPYALDALLIASYPRELDGHEAARRPSADRSKPERPGGASAVGDTRVGGNRVIAAFGETVRELARAARTPRLAITVVNASLLGGFYKAAKDFLQPMVRALALSLPVLAGVEGIRRSAVLIGIVYSLLYIATSFTSRFAGDLAERLGSLQKALNIELLVGLGLTFAAGAFHAFGLPAPAVVLFMFLFVLHNARRPLSVTFMSDAVSQDIQAAALSVESQVQSLFGAAFALAIGAVADAAGGSVGVGVAVVAGVALAAFPAYRLRKLGR
jgi:hypothetical protein